MKKTLLIHFLLSIALCSAIVFYLDPKLSGIMILTLFTSIFLGLWLLSFVFYPRYYTVLKWTLNLTFYFLKELIVSNVNMIYFIVAPGQVFRPAILEFPLRLKSDFGITLMANLITLTPGTITLEVSEDKKYLYFHIVNVPDRNLEKAKQKLRDGFEKRIMKITA